ncbi:MAG: hypothetical protein WD906_01555 [Anaerolineales bacterium]
MEKKQFVIVLMACLAVVMAGCASAGVVQVEPPPPNTFNAPGPNPELNTADADGNVAGIWPGIWHGIISPVTLVMSFLNTDSRMYEVHNNGSQYDLGFLIGAAIVFGLLGVTAGRRRR